MKSKIAAVAVLAMLAGLDASPSYAGAKPPTDTRIAAGGSCLRSQVSTGRSGRYSVSTTLTLTNTCGWDLAAYVCSGTRFSGPANDNCRFVGNFAPMRFRPGQVTTSSLSSGGTPYVQIRECPRGYATRQGLISNWQCDR